jgi:hypothetical protein
VASPDRRGAALRENFEEISLSEKERFSGIGFDLWFFLERRFPSILSARIPAARAGVMSFAYCLPAFSSIPFPSFLKIM